MSVAIIGIPAGMKVPTDMKQLTDLREKGVISYFETRDRELILYWRELAPRKKIDLTLSLVCDVPGSYRGPASRAYLYYDADNKHWVEPLAVKIANGVGRGRAWLCTRGPTADVLRGSRLRPPATAESHGHTPSGLACKATLDRDLQSRPSRGFRPLHDDGGERCRVGRFQQVEIEPGGETPLLSRPTWSVQSAPGGWGANRTVRRPE